MELTTNTIEGLKPDNIVNPVMDISKPSFLRVCSSLVANIAPSSSLVRLQGQAIHTH
jgi:hypothetical protein